MPPILQKLLMKRSTTQKLLFHCIILHKPASKDSDILLIVNRSLSGVLMIKVYFNYRENFC